MKTLIRFLMNSLCLLMLSIILLAGTQNANGQNFMDFQGANSNYINVPDNSSLRITGDITVECWFRADANPSPTSNDWVRLVGKGNSSLRNYGIWYNPNGTFLFQQYGSSNWSASAGGFSFNQWYHIAGVRSGTSAYLYINGNLVGSSGASGTPHTSADPLTIGSAVSFHSFHNGQMDEVRVWNVARSQDQIQSGMNKALNGTESGLLVYYSFEDGNCGSSNSSTIADQSLSGFNGSATNFSLNGCSSNYVCNSSCGITSNGVTPIGSSNFLDLDGSNDYLQTPPSPELNSASTAYTVELWIYPDGAPNETWKGIIGRGSGGPRNYNFWLNNAGYVHHRFHTTSSNNDGAPNTPSGSISWSTWNHVALTNDGTTARTYINGSPQASGTFSGSLVEDNFPLYIGRNLDGGSSNYFDGKIDEVRIWNYARTQSQIQNDMNNRLTGSESGLVLYYPFDQGTCGGNNTGITILEDESPEDNDATMNSFTLNGCSSNFVCTESCGYAANAVSVAAVPTLSEWGVVLLILLVLCFEGAVIWRRKNSYSLTI